jgi:hypothetical protein
MSTPPLCTRHGNPQIPDKRGRYIGRCKVCMQEDAAKRQVGKTVTKPTKRGAAVVEVDFTLYPELLAFVRERAEINVRTVQQEILYRLQVSMKSIQAGFKSKGQ